MFVLKDMVFSFSNQYCSSVEEVGTSMNVTLVIPEFNYLRWSRISLAVVALLTEDYLKQQTLV